MNKWDVRRANAAVKAFEAQIAGGSYNYNQAANKIANEEKNGMYGVQICIKKI